MKEKPLVSVVTPVYNGARYISEAVSSVINQTYSNWEYLIVDDCSTDNTIEIIRKFAYSDNRIRILQNNRRLHHIDNFNHMMRQLLPNSKYCKVLHADDFLFPECIASMVKLAEEYPSIGIVSAYRLEGEMIKNTGIPYPVQFLAGREVCRRSLLEETFYVFGSPSSILLRSDLIRSRDPFYNPGFFSDAEACYRELMKSDFGFVHQVLSYSRLHGKSWTSSVEGFGMNYLGLLNALQKFGSHYLSGEEYEDRLRKRLNDYYRFLGVSYLQKREKKFWQHQESTLNEMGLFLDSKRVRTAALGVFFANITRPDQYKRIFQRWFKGEKTARQYRL